MPPKRKEVDAKVLAQKEKEPKELKEKSKKETKSKKGSRRFDYFYIITYIIFLFGVFLVSVAHCSTIIPEILKPNLQQTCQQAQVTKGYLGHVFEAYHKWGSTVFTQEWSFALKVVYRTNLLFLAPVSLVLIYGFFFGRNWIKNIGIIHASIMFYNMIIIDTVDLKAETESLRIFVYICHGFQTFFPLAVIARLWSNEPFKAGNSNIFAKFGKIICIVWLLASIVTYYEFAVKNTDSFKGLPSVVDNSVSTWEKTAPHVETIVSGAKVASYVGAEYTGKVASSVHEFADGVGKKVLEYVGTPNSP